MSVAAENAGSCNSPEPVEPLAQKERALAETVQLLSQKYLTQAVGTRLEVPTNAEWDELHTRFQSYHGTHRDTPLTFENIGKRWQKLDKKAIGLRAFLDKWVDRLCQLPMSPRSRVYHALLALDPNLDAEVIHNQAALWERLPEGRLNTEVLGRRQRTAAALKSHPRLRALKYAFDFLGTPQAQPGSEELGGVFDGVAGLVSSEFKNLEGRWKKIDLAPQLKSRLESELKPFNGYAALLELRWQQGVWQTRFGSSTTQLQRILPLMEQGQFARLRSRFFGSALAPVKMHRTWKQMTATARQRRHRGNLQEPGVTGST